MTNKLAIIVLGNRNAGKSETWKRLFNQVNIRTSSKKRKLYLNKIEYVDVFLINGSPEERGLEVDEIIKVETDILLCSVQYNKHGLKTIKKLYNCGFQIYIQWLNPGFADRNEYNDYLYILEELKALKNLETHKRSGKKEEVINRVSDIHSYIYNMAQKNNLLKTNKSNITTKTN
ncbi:hypothetical protein NST63_20190 [Heyndrickxia sp. FSL W8-0496]|jgi:hypothetical protein|uniref:hypothetical protein n=1 Tax=Heyndrickxia TaxID=2837504 RepID=UPI0030FA1108